MSLVLFGVCAISACALAFVYRAVAAPIAAQEREEKKKALQYIIPGCDEYAEKTADKKPYYEAKKDGVVVGYIIQAEGKGYGGPIRMMVGFDAQGVIQGIYVLSHQETPGLGDRINEINKGEEKPWFLKQFEGKKAQDLKLSSIQTITGATITSRGITEGIRTQVEEFLRARRGRS